VLEDLGYFLHIIPEILALLVVQLGLLDDIGGFMGCVAHFEITIDGLYWLLEEFICFD
jgi:hypothetical protein